MRKIKTTTAYKWKSVNRRLPKIDGYYLVAKVCLTGKHYDRIEPDYFMESLGGFGDEDKDYKITHWDYLPTPPSKAFDLGQ